MASHTSKAQHADPDPPSFLDLRAEIRNTVYELLFVRDEPIPLFLDNPQDLGQWHHLVNGVQLLATCRQVCTEATPILYARNTFLIQSCPYDPAKFRLVENLAMWLEDIVGSSNLIKSLQIRLSRHS
jgi:hypothetical protein